MARSHRITTTADQPQRIKSAPAGPGLDLQCPECTQAVHVARAELVEGAAVHCGHCGTDAELTHETDDTTGKTRWILVDPAADYDDAG